MSAGGWRVGLRRVGTGAQAVAIGFAVTFLVRLVTAPVPRAIRVMSPAPWIGRWVGGLVMPVLLPVLGSVLAGYVVARLHPQERRLAVGSYLGFVLLLGLPRAVTLVANLQEDNRYVAGLVVHGVNLILVLGAVAVGGRLGSRADRAPSRLWSPAAAAGQNPEDAPVRALEEEPARAPD